MKAKREQVNEEMGVIKPVCKQLRKRSSISKFYTLLMINQFLYINLSNTKDGPVNLKII